MFIETIWKYNDREKMLRWLIESRLTGKNLVQWIRYRQYTPLEFVRAILARIEGVAPKDRPVFAREMGIEPSIKL